MAVTATKVPDDKRLGFLPKYFGTHLVQVENEIYNFMSALSDDYSGGYWEFYELSNGGAYMAPTGIKFIKVDSPNGFSANLSGEAAGIVACLFAFSNLSFKYPEIGKWYHLLREYTYDLPEVQLIYKLTD